MNRITKRLILYILGLFLLALGATFSIRASLGVSPVTSLPYALALITPFSVGITTVFANAVFIVIQALLLKEIRWKNFFLQFIISFVFGAFMDIAVWLTSFLPSATNMIFILVYFILSLFVVAFALILYFTAELPMMPYDALTYVISNQFKMPFGKAKITSDSINVLISLLLCLIFIHAFGSIGIGTFIAAYAIGKILGLLLPKVQPHLKTWLN
jgi:uncharacterized protein